MIVSQDKDSFEDLKYFWNIFEIFWNIFEIFLRSHSKQSSLSPRSSFSVGGSIEEDGRDLCEEEEEGPAQYRVSLLGSARAGKSTIIEKFFSAQTGGSWVTSGVINMTGSASREWDGWEVVGCHAGGDRDSLSVYRTAHRGNGRWDAVRLILKTNLTKDPDTAGENECIVVVFSLADSSSLEDSKMILDKLWQSGVTGTVPLILVGNKTDLVRSRQVSVEGEKDMTDEALRKYLFRCEEFGPAARCQVCWGERGAGPQCRHPPGGDRQADQTVATLCHCWHREERTEVRPNLWEKRIILKVEFQYLSYSYIIKERDEKHNTMSGKECSPRETVKHLFLLQFIQLWK